MKSMNDQPTVILERIDFSSGSDVFSGKVYRPEDLSACKGIVIFTHGLGYCDRQYKVSGESFAKSNYLMLIYNLRGHAGSPGAWTLKASVDDLIAAINALTQKYDFPNKNRICAMGHSTGALITLLASLKDKRIKFASIVTIVTSLTDSFLHWFSSGFNIEVKEFFKSKGVIPKVVDEILDDKSSINKFKNHGFSPEEINVPHRYGMLKSPSVDQFFKEIVFSANILDEAQKIHIPVLLFRGEYDEIIDVWKTNELYEKLVGRTPSKLYITKSRNHFHNDSWELIQEETLRFFDECCEYTSPKADLLDKDILLVDDDHLVTKTLALLLQKNGFKRVETASSGMDALKKIASLRTSKSKEFDLIIADIRMPDIDGIETIRRVRKIIADVHGKQSPVIFITGFEGKRTQEEAADVGYVDYLYKPLDANYFISSVRKQLA